MSGSHQNFRQQKLILRHIEERYFDGFAENFENINLVKSYDKRNPTYFIFSLWKKYRWELIVFVQYI